jgi:hypothetical protein
MKTAAELAKCAEQLTGLTYLEWIRLKLSIDNDFNRRKSEYERTLTLAPIKDIEEAVNRVFG